MEYEDIMTLREAAKYLRISDKLLKRLIDEKKLNATKVGRAWRIRKVDINSFLEREGTLNEVK